MRIVLLMLFFIGSLLANVAVVSAFSGSANILRNGKKIDINIGLKILKQDIITTGNNGKVQLLFKDDTIITIGKNAKFAIIEYIYDENKKNKSKALFNFMRGFFRTVTGVIGKINPEGFNIKAKTATIGIRGTRFDVFVSNRVIKTALFDGKIIFMVNNIKKFLYPGQRLIYIIGGEIKIEQGTLKESKQMYERKTNNKKNISQKDYNEGNVISTDIEKIIDLEKEKNDDFLDIEALTQKELDSLLIGDVFENIKIYKTPKDIIEAKKGTANYSGDVVGKYTDPSGAVSSESGKISLTLDFDNQKVSGSLYELSGEANKFNTGILSQNSELDNESFNSQSFSNTNIKNGVIGGYYYGNHGKVVAGGINLEHNDNSKFDAVFIGKEEQDYEEPY